MTTSQTIIETETTITVANIFARRTVDAVIGQHQSGAKYTALREISLSLSELTDLDQDELLTTDESAKWQQVVDDVVDAQAEAAELGLDLGPFLGACDAEDAGKVYRDALDAAKADTGDYWR